MSVHMTWEKYRGRELTIKYQTDLCAQTLNCSIILKFSEMGIACATCILKTSAQLASGAVTQKSCKNK